MTVQLIIVCIIYCILPFLSTPLLFMGLYTDKKNYKYYISGIILNLGLIGYYYIPSVTNDLFRHFQRIEPMKYESLSQVLLSKSLIVQNIWFYLVSITGNVSLLPLSAVIITFYLTLNPLMDFSINNKISSLKTIICIMLIIVWMHLIWPISGVRNSASIAVFFYGLYNEFVLCKGKSKSYFIYACSILIHHSVFILIVLRLSLSAFYRFNDKLKFILIIWGVFANIVVDQLSKVNISYINQVVYKANVYIGYKEFSRFGILNLIIKLFFCITYIIFYYKLKRTNKDAFYKYKQFYEYGFILSLFCIGAFNSLLILDRLGYLVLSFIPFVIMPTVFRRESLIDNLYIVFVIPLLILGLFTQFIYFRNASFEINIFKLMTRNIIRLLIKK